MRPALSERLRRMRAQRPQREQPRDAGRLGATAGYRVRQYAPFGMAPSMVVSIYSWEKTGPVSELVGAMGTTLAARFGMNGRS